MKKYGVAIFASLIMFAANAACKVKNNDTTLKLIGGIEDDNSYPEAVGLISKLGDGQYLGCTGTIVRDDLVLTAAHCLENALNVFVAETLSHGNLEGRFKASQSFVRFPTYDPKPAAVSQLNADIAFVVFPKGSFAGHAMGKIASSSPQKGEAVRLVGYGRTDLGSQQSNPQLKRHTGANTVEELIPKWANAILLKTTTVGMSTAGAASGDSGGALFNSTGEVAGIASGVAGAERNLDISSKSASWSIYLNVNDPGVAAFIKIVMSTQNPTASTAQSVKPTPIQLERTPQVGLESPDSSTPETPRSDEPK